MKTLRVALALVTALAASAAFAGPRGKNVSVPAGSATYRTDSAAAGCKMVEKSGKRTTSVPCTGETEKCKAHCEK